jgi:hypothetical protein
MNFATDAANPSCISWPLRPFCPVRDGATEGLIVVKINGEGRGVPCRVIMPTQKL